MNKKFQVFISSTFKDLVQERQDTIRSVLDLGHIPSGMEVFPAADVEQFEYIKKVVDECDYYVLIIGARYGSMDAAGISFTEKEYDYAVETNRVVLAFIHGAPEQIAVARADTDAALSAKLQAFREKVSAGRLVQSWKTPEELKSKVIIALTKAIGEMPGVGWIRGSAVASEELLAQINELRNENDSLRGAYASLEKEIKPQLAGIAGLNDEFNVRYSHYSSFARDRRNSSVKMTWGEIFSAIGPQLVRPHSPQMISSWIVKYVAENKPVADESMIVFDTDENTIKFHLIALGLIKSAAGNQVGGGVAEFISLTERGQRTLIERLAAKLPAS
jgi:hypothetical protein